MKGYFEGRIEAPHCFVISFQNNHLIFGTIKHYPMDCNLIESYCLLLALWYLAPVYLLAIYRYGHSTPG